MAYTTKAKVEALIGQSIPASMNDAVTSYIAAVKQWIDNYVGSTFEAADPATIRYFDGNSRESIFIDDFIGNPTVELLNADGSSLSNLTEGVGSDYLVYPLNSTSKSELRFTRNGTYYRFPRGNYRIKVTAKWGKTATVPADVELVATKLVGKLVTDALNDGDIASVTLGDYSISYVQARTDENAKAMGIYSVLDMYREIQI